MTEPTHSSRWLTAAVAILCAKPDVCLPQSLKPETPPGIAQVDDPDRGPIAPAEILSQAFQRAVRAVSPSVVNIRAIKWTQRYELSSPSRHSASYDPLKQFFGKEFLDRFFEQRAPVRGYEHRTVGTGVVVTKDGYVLTNELIVANAGEVVVGLPDGRSFEADIIGIDIKTDLALLKIEGASLTPGRLGDTQEAEVGDWVVAVGNPFSLSHTLATGVISAKGRANAAITAYEDFLQTDAPIHAGNTGGPLVDLQGRVVGICTARPWGGNAVPGMGFAVPSSMARVVMDDLIQDGVVQRGSIGIIVQNLNRDLAMSFGHKDANGVLVADVAPEGPAETAGVRPGDIILAFDGHETPGVNEYRSIVAGTRPGRGVAVEFYRGGQKQTTQVQVQNAAAQVRLPRGKQHPVGLGLTLRTLSALEAARMGLERTRGVLVTNVDSGTLAMRAGIRPDDIIVAVGDRSVSDVAGFHGALKAHDLSQGVRFQLVTEGTRRFVFLKRHASPPQP